MRLKALIFSLVAIAFVAVSRGQLTQVLNNQPDASNGELKIIEGNNKEFFVYPKEIKTWTKAKEFCATKTKTLASLENMKLPEVWASLPDKSTPYWTASKAIEFDGVEFNITWSDGKDATTVSRQNYPASLDDRIYEKDTNCLRLFRNQLENGLCGIELPVLCEKAKTL